ncbi:MAG TPA: 4Fe-4S binding protein [Syntrophales bacterium]|jgi:ferredoxin|nr:4Fe-4S binding protein [Syntrophales bacterium]
MKSLFSFLSGLPVKPSTRAFLREAESVPGYGFLDFVHGYVYGRWPSLYVGMATGCHPLARILGPPARLLLELYERSVRCPDSGMPPGKTSFADAYHGKVMPLEGAIRLVSVQREVCLQGMESVVPYPVARDLILREPDRMVALECPCRAHRADPCRPLDVCLVVGEPFASFAREHNPRKSRWITPEEAASILKAEHDRGHVHHAFFKDAMLDRFYAICNCCSCCCGAMNAYRDGSPMLASSGYVCWMDASLCVGCGNCVGACPFRAIGLIGDKAVVDPLLCMGCGICVDGCPTGALSLLRDVTRSVPLEIP